ncbi:AI-2E family transporter [Hippea alviniae]|uniref:AI-2E family transporter n=1 Tax=Hippea alviniae TaxID=1279027 RepID=UPI0003B45C12|nr:AI-2E family transporter [Hippea alviniae]
MTKSHSGLFEYFIFLVFLIGGVYLLFFKLTFITIIVFLSYLIAQISYPFENMLLKFKIPRWITGLLVLSIIMGGMALIFIIAVPALINQIAGIEKQIPDLINGINREIGKLYAYLGSKLAHNKEIYMITNSALESVKGYLVSFAVNSVTGLLKGVSALAVFLLMPIISFFMIIYRDKYKAIVRSIILTVLGEDYLSVFQDIHNVIIGYIVGLLILMIVVSALSVAGLYVVGVDYALLFGVLGGVLYIIPYLGAIISFIPPIIVALVVHHSFLMSVEVLVVLLFIHFISGNIIAPYIYSKQLELDPLAVLLAILFFGKLLGVWGVILSVPLLGIIVVSYEKLVPILIKRRSM